MEPNFHNGEYILTDKVSYRIHTPKRGDVVVFHSPQDERVDFIKRILGVPGDTIKVQSGYIYLNNVKLEEDFVNDPGQVLGGRFLHENVEVNVPPGQYFVMGDNRNHSSDSREWGFVTTNGIVGRAFFRYWPISEFGVVPTAEAEITVGTVKGAISTNNAR